MDTVPNSARARHCLACLVPLPRLSLPVKYTLSLARGGQEGGKEEEEESIVKRERGKKQEGKVRHEREVGISYEGETGQKDE